MFRSGVLAATEMPYVRTYGTKDGCNGYMNGMKGFAEIPIADIPSNSKYSQEEVRLRNQLASLYRLVDKFHWSQAIYNHMTVRIPTEGKSHEILINPFGRLYNEVTASNLIKVDLEGNVIDQGTSDSPLNQAGYVLHSIIHKARPDVQCVIHLHTPSVAAVSSMECGLLMLCQEAMIIGPVAYHDYEGIIVDTDEDTTLASDLGDKDVMILRNHGFVVCGKTVEEAFTILYHLILACETQVKAMSASAHCELHMPAKEACLRAMRTARTGGAGVNREKNSGCVDTDRWGVGELEWQAFMRLLDSQGLQTGYDHKKI